jgi:hypothetical protein
VIDTTAVVAVWPLRGVLFATSLESNDE